MRIILLRHPQTVANDQGYIYGKKDYPYTELGERQLAWAVNQVSFMTGCQIISSPLKRALTLAKAVGEVLNVPVELDEDLEEMGYGILEGLTVEGGRQLYPEVVHAFLEGEEDYIIPEGESPYVFEERVISALDRCLEEDEDVLLVTHGGVIRTALEYLLGLVPGDSWKLGIGNCAILEIKCDEGYHRLTKLVNIEEDLL